MSLIISFMSRKYERNISNRRGIGGKGSERRRYLCYALYAFGFPILFGIMIYTFDNGGILKKNWRPDMGVEKCGVQGSTEAFYVYVPIICLLLLNVAFYSITAHKIYSVRKETKLVRKGDSTRHSNIDLDKARLISYHFNVNFFNY